MSKCKTRKKNGSTYNDRYVKKKQDEDLDVIGLVVDGVEVIIVGQRQYLQIVVHRFQWSVWTDSIYQKYRGRSGDHSESN